MWKVIREARSDIIGGLVVAAILGVISALYAVAGIRAFAPATLACIWLGCAYLALKRTPPFVNGGKGDWKYPRWRRWALVALVVIPLLIVSVVGYHFYNQAQPPTKIVILVANFDGPEPKKYRVTETVGERLSLALEKYDDVKVQYVKRAFENSSSARSEGEKHKATIIIWGWYGVTEEAGPLSVHFELLRPPKDMPELGPNLKGGVQTATIAELESITLQSRLAVAMTSLSLFTVGMTRYAVQDWQGAIALFDDALWQTTERMPGLDWSTYFYRGNACLFRGDFDQAVADYTESIELRDDHAEVYNNRGNAYRHKGAYEKAIADYNRAIELKPGFADAYNNRGVAYYDQGDYNQAIADYSEAVELKRDYAAAYNNCGNAYTALRDYNRAITTVKPSS